MERRDRKMRVGFGGEMGPGVEELTAADAISEAMVDGRADEHTTTTEGRYLI